MTAPQQQKLRISGPVVITANRLIDGAVVYRAPGNLWKERLEDAIVVTEAEEARRLLAEASVNTSQAVDPYVAPVIIDEGAISPGNLRERIRSRGPTIALPAEAKD